MAEQLQTSDITTTTQNSNLGLLNNVGNTLDKLRKFSNEPASY